MNNFLSVVDVFPLNRTISVLFLCSPVPGDLLLLIRGHSDLNGSLLFQKLELILLTQSLLSGS